MHFLMLRIWLALLFTIFFLKKRKRKRKKKDCSRYNAKNYSFVHMPLSLSFSLSLSLSLSFSLHWAQIVGFHWVSAIARIVFRRPRTWEWWPIGGAGFTGSWGWVWQRKNQIIFIFISMMYYQKKKNQYGRHI